MGSWNTLQGPRDKLESTTKGTNAPLCILLSSKQPAERETRRDRQTQNSDNAESRDISFGHHEHRRTRQHEAATTMPALATTRVPRSQQKGRWGHVRLASMDDLRFGSEQQARERRRGGERGASFETKKEPLKLLVLQAILAVNLLCWLKEDHDVADYRSGKALHLPLRL